MNEGGVRVAFVVHERIWLGGLNYLRNLMAAMQSIPDNALTPVIVTGARALITPEQFPRIEMIRTTLLDRKSPAWFVRKVIATTFRRDLLFERFLLRNGIRVLSHSRHLGKQTSIVTIGWIPDFQHIHLPQGFTQEQLRSQSRSYEDTCAGCTKVIVSSECALKDLENLNSAWVQKAEVLRFVAAPAPLSAAAPLSELIRTYHFEPPYFLLPNQFWSHKNHRVVLAALRVLKEKNRPFLVLATGPTKDDRNSSFFPLLMKYAEECGVTDLFRVLGPVPFPHLTGLMLHTIAIINPSKFEGWSTTVEEAKSLGKVIILSDIPVHREQAPALGRYFDPDNPEQLADLMTEAVDRYTPTVDFENQEGTRKLFAERQLDFGRVYEAIVKRAL